MKLKYEESNIIEFKEVLTDDLNFEKEVVAFLNYSEGGIIYIGIDKNKKVVGVDNPDTIQLKIKDRIKNNIAPSTIGLYDVVLVVKEGIHIIIIMISTGNIKPYYIRKYGRSPEGCFLRIGSAKNKMSEEMIEDLFISHTQVSLKDIPSPKQDLTFRQLRILYDQNQKDLSDTSFLANLGLLTEDKKLNYVAYLVADSNSVPIPVARYAGNDRIDLLEAKECGFKSLLPATIEILSLIEAYNKRYMHKTNYGHETAYMYEFDAIKEAFVNAVVHNDYTMSSTPCVKFFNDRMEIIWGGGLPDGLIIDAFFKGIISRRNPELVKIFQDVKLTENLGSGMRKILRYYDKSCFEFVGKYIICTFKFKPNPFVNEFNSSVSEIKNVTDDVTVNVTDKITIEDKILRIIESDKNVTQEKISKILGISRMTVYRIIKKSNKIKRVGSDKNGHWEIIENKKD